MKKWIWIGVTVCISFLILAGCSYEDREGKPVDGAERTHSERQTATPEFFTESTVKSLIVPSHSFERIFGWQDDTSILYSEVDEGITSLVSYHLFTGEREYLYQTDKSISKIRMNESGSFIAVQEVLANHQSQITIIDIAGHIKNRTSISSNDLELLWNPYDHDELLVIAMYMNWDFDIFLWEVEANDRRAVEVDNPFVHWLSSDSLAFLNWQLSDHESFQAPLTSFHFKNRKNGVLVDDVVAFFTYRDLLLTVTENSGDASQGLFSFYRIGQGIALEKINQFSFPIFNTFSDQWWVPEHDYIESEGIFYYLLPAKNRDSITFQLHAFSVHDGTSKQVITLSDQSPISCSPNGRWCLAGQGQEVLIDIDQKEQIDLIPPQHR